MSIANSELQRKLESQTQRLELAIQQQAHATPHAASPSATFFSRTPKSLPRRPSLQLQPGQPWLHQAEALNDRQVIERWPPGEGESASGSTMQMQGQQRWQSPPAHAKSAPPTPQQAVRRPLRAPSGMLTTKFVP